MKKITIKDVEISYTVVERNVKYPRLELKSGCLVLILRRGINDEKGILIKHSDWIYKKVMEINRIRIYGSGIEPVIRTKDLFKETVNKYLRLSETELGVKSNKIIFKTMTSKWGSCSAKGTITLNNYMTGLPARLIAYIIYHELVHLQNRRHDNVFFRKVQKRFPDYKKLEDELAAYWFVIKQRIEHM